MWLHLVSSLETTDINSIVDVLLPPLVRELSTGDAMAPASPVKQLATRLGKKLRRKIGDIEYSKLLAEAQTRLNIRRAERKKVSVHHLLCHHHYRPYLISTIPAFDFNDNQS